MVWKPGLSDFRVLDIPAIVFWLNPSLRDLLLPLVDEVGVDLFRLLVARAASLGTDVDYRAMVTQLGSTFEDGFAGWSQAAATVGWGTYSLEKLDRAGGTAVVRIRNPWEVRTQQEGKPPWGCPFSQGKLIGIFSHALGGPCWADEVIDQSGEVPEVVFRIYRMERTIEGEIHRLRRERLLSMQADLQERIDDAAAELRQNVDELAKRDRLIRTLSTPIIQVWDDVLVVPLVGELSAERSDLLNGDLLTHVVSSAATAVVLDLTGLSSIDSATAERLSKTIAALRLVGAECAVVGLSPTLAQAMVELGISLDGVRTLRTLADALREVVGLVRMGRRAPASLGR